MAIPYYLPGALFLLFIICCLVFLILIYWKASSVLQNQEGGCEAEDDDVSGGGEIVEEKIPTTTTTAYHRLKSVPPLDETTSPDDEPEHEEVAVIEHCTFELALRYSLEHKYFSGSIENVQGMVEHKSRRINSVRFHIALIPSKKRIKTGYRSLKELNINIPFGIRNINLEDMRGSAIRFRLYGRRLEFGVPVTKEKCIGEAYIKLNEHMESFAVSGEIRTRQTILPKSQQFPAHEDDFLFSDEA